MIMGCNTTHGHQVPYTRKYADELPACRQDVKLVSFMKSSMFIWAQILTIYRFGWIFQNKDEMLLILFQFRPLLICAINSTYHWSTVPNPILVRPPTMKSPNLIIVPLNQSLNLIIVYRVTRLLSGKRWEKFKRSHTQPFTRGIDFYIHYSLPTGEVKPPPAMSFKKAKKQTRATVSLKIFVAVVPNYGSQSSRAFGRDTFGRPRSTVTSVRSIDSA